VSDLREAEMNVLEVADRQEAGADSDTPGALWLLLSLASSDVDRVWMLR
jgi:hypothetical protein